jgi:hypothetical protein
MITPAEETFIRQRAYVPEHIPGYGSVMSEGEPFLFDDFLVYHKKEMIVFIGYPLRAEGDEKRLEKVLDAAVQRFSPGRVSLIGPHLPSQSGTRGKSDTYFRLDLTHTQIRSKVKNMIRRAARDLSVEKSRTLTDQHHRLIADFIQSSELDQGSKTLFKKIPEYFSLVSTSEIFSAWDSRGSLIAFDVAEFAAKEYVFYMFNFRSRSHSVPGASDLLLNAMILEAKLRGKSMVNLGLGINPGVSFFKEKWGAVPFLRHESVVFRARPPSFFESLFQGTG